MVGLITTAERLRGSRYDSPEILDEIICDGFESCTKRLFVDSSKIYWLRVGDRSENDIKLGIRRGCLRLAGCAQRYCDY